MVFPGYLFAWFTNLQGFRRRSLVERMFWSVPLSIAISTIFSVLLGRLLPFTALAVFFILCSVACLACVAWEWSLQQRNGAKWSFGMQPLGNVAIILVLAWISLALISLLDIQSGQQLFLSLTLFDHGARVNWADAVLRTGLPPHNPFYFFEHPGNLRYYYFWLVDCAVVARITSLPMRVIVFASCIWSGFALVALLGLYLKHFLRVGIRLRKQLILAIGLLAIPGPYIVVDIWDILVLHAPPPGIEVWPKGQITSWIDNFYYYPHHVASFVCCMFAFLLAWINKDERGPRRVLTIVIVGASFASAFGLSIYVAFAFFLIMLAWGVWQLVVEREPKPVLHLAAGSVVAAILLLPYLHELNQGSSKVYGGHVFGFSVRETISPAGLLASPIFRNLGVAHPRIAHSLAKLVLMIPGYAVELGFLSFVLLAYLAPRWRSKPLNAAQRSLLFLTFATFPFISFIRSEVLDINDFGIHGGMFPGFCLLLLASDLLLGWKRRSQPEPPIAHDASIPQTPLWLTSSARVFLFLGALSTIYIASILRFGILASPDMHDHRLSHKAYISAIGYARMNAAIPRDAVVQFDPVSPDAFWINIDLVNINRQAAMVSDQPWCGSELGGDPSGCPGMIAAIPPLFRQATSAAAASAVCRTYHIDYLVANIYDPVWNDKSGWAWTLPPVVSDPEFRALDCRTRP